MSVFKTAALKQKKIFTIVIISVAALILTSFIVVVSIMANDENIYKGIYVNSFNVGGMNLEEVSSLLEDKYKAETVNIPFVFEEKTFSVPAHQIDFKYLCFEGAMEAYKEGRHSNFFVRAKNVLFLRFKNKTLKIPVSLNNEKLLEFINSNISDHITPAVQTKVLIKDDKLEITNGKSGMGVNIEKLSEIIRNSYSAGEKISNFKISVEKKEPDPLNVDILYERYYTEPKDVEFKVVDGVMHYTNHTLGISFDKVEAERILIENKDNSQTYAIPIKVTVPEKTAKWFADNYCSDNLGTFTTGFSSVNVGRVQNIDLAAKKINDYVLAPGEVFSFNKVVGKRTEDTGFKTAKVYQAGEIVDGIGGGICQVSSTLYNAVLLADLEIVSRTNHSMPVPYIEAGKDATVSYDAIDLMFSNNTKYPIKINCIASNRDITCNIFGIRSENKTVEITTETVSVIPFVKKKVTDNSLPPGKTRMSQSGSNGCIVNTYKSVFIDGELVEKKLISVSVYQSIQQIILVGPQPVAPTKTPDDQKTSVETNNFLFPNIKIPLPEKNHNKIEPNDNSETEDLQNDISVP